MAIAIPSLAATHTRENSTTQRLPGIAIAAVASIGAGAIHAGAIGIHAEHQSLARIFIAVAVFQLGWGLVALLHPSRWLAVVGAAGSLAVVGGWLLTRLSGISFVTGLEVRETAQFADTACALLGVVAAGTAFSAAVIGWRAIRPQSLTFPSLMALAITIPAMLAGANHSHAGGDTEAAHPHGTASSASSAGVVVDESLPHGHDGATAATAATTSAAVVVAAPAAAEIDESVAHGHPADAQPASDSTADDSAAIDAAAVAGVDGSASADTTPTTEHPHTSAVVAPVPYDPTKPIDLGGVEGVTPEQQARAENLVAITLIRLPQWSDPAVAEAAGFQSIGDGRTGFEHYIQWSWIDDDVYLNPDFPESLVYQPQPDGSKKLLSAMFMLPRDVALTDVPDIGGALTQWHIHNNLCYTDDPVAPKVVGLTNADGTCAPPLKKMGESPMIHVWIQPHECGPFAALEGVGAGQINTGEERLCDQAHGGSGF